MTLQSSGAISLANIASEFGGSTPHSLSEYYGVAGGVPSSGTISMSQFYGTSAPAYVYATGGSVSQSGNYRTHYFYGSGYFYVSNSGNSGGSNSVTALIVAGGGGGAGIGGGGAGGYRYLSFGIGTGNHYVSVGGGGSSVDGGDGGDEAGGVDGGDGGDGSSGTDTGEYLAITIDSSNEVFAPQRNIGMIDISTAAGAVEATELLDVAIQQISAEQAKLGAVQNRLYSAIDNLRTQAIQTETAKSRVVDADFTIEMTKLIKKQILSQAASQILNQANTSKQNVLGLM